jgi:hypothetical protein
VRGVASVLGAGSPECDRGGTFGLIDPLYGIDSSISMDKIIAIIDFS